MVDKDNGLFRREALQAQEAGWHAEGRLLDNRPPWTGYIFWFLFAMTAVGLLYLIVGRISEYAEGPAIIRFEGRTHIVSTATGVVERVHVDSGQSVRAGQPLVELDSEGEAAELRRIDSELEARTILLLRDLTNEDARQSIAQLRGQRQLAEERLRQRVVLADGAGVVSDVRIREGQQARPGDHFLTVKNSEEERVVVAFLPGHYRPQLQVGMELRLELVGYKYSYRPLRVTWIAEELVGEAEIRRHLPPTVADTVAVPASAVIVRATLPPPELMVDGTSYDFISGGEAYRYYDGMQAMAAIRVKREPIIVRIIPALRRFLDGGHGE